MVINGQLCQEYLYQKLLKSDNQSSSYNHNNVWDVFGDTM